MSGWYHRSRRGRVIRMYHRKIIGLEVLVKGRRRLVRALGLIYGFRCSFSMIFHRFSDFSENTKVFLCVRAFFIIFLHFASKSIVFVEKLDRFLQDGLRDPTGRAFASFSHAERHSVVELVCFEWLQ